VPSWLLVLVPILWAAVAGYYIFLTPFCN